MRPNKPTLDLPVRSSVKRTRCSNTHDAKHSQSGFWAIAVNPAVDGVWRGGRGIHYPIERHIPRSRPANDHASPGHRVMSFSSGVFFQGPNQALDIEYPEGIAGRIADLIPVMREGFHDIGVWIDIRVQPVPLEPQRNQITRTDVRVRGYEHLDTEPDRRLGAAGQVAVRMQLRLRETGPRVVGGWKVGLQPDLRHQ